MTDIPMINPRNLVQSLSAVVAAHAEIRRSIQSQADERAALMKEHDATLNAGVRVNPIGGRGY